MVDEMFLQKEASYQSGDYVGEDEEGELYYSYNIVQAHGVGDVRAVYTQIFDRFSPQIDICCSKHNNWGLKFAAKIVINTFFNNKQAVSSDSARKDTVVAFKKRQRTK